MSQPDKLKLTVQAAVHEIEHTLSPRYPQHFTNIDAAKRYVKKLAHDANYDYTLPRNYNLQPTLSHPTVRDVKNRACFIVAIRAYDQGEFYLNEALPDRESLRKAVESNISRIRPFLRTWPPSFCNADVAAKYVAGVCAGQRFSYTRFEGVAEEKFGKYVTWNTARQAWEQGCFELGVVPQDWVRKPKVEKPITLMGKSFPYAIEADIARLMPIIRSWPSTFTDLNAARNFVQHCCGNNRFRYAGWPDVEQRKYRLFVHFNTAKYALQKGLFKVERTVPKRTGMTRTVSQMRDSNWKQVHMVKKQEDGIEIIQVRAAVTQDTEQTGGCGTAKRSRHIETVATNGSKINNTGEPDQDSPIPSCEISDPEDDILVQATTKLEEKTPVAADPFKDLITELQRGYVLKAAFD